MVPVSISLLELSRISNAVFDEEGKGLLSIIRNSAKKMGFVVNAWIKAYFLVSYLLHG